MLFCILKRHDKLSTTTLKLKFTIDKHSHDILIKFEYFILCLTNSSTCKKYS